MVKFIRPMVMVPLLLGFAAAAMGAAADGKALFARHCAGCHYGGGNLINPAKPLTRLHRQANGIRTSGDLVSKMRRGGAGMPRFSARQISEPDAQAIADYIIRTFD